ncbi:Stabilin-2 [Gaertneriomyces sp. JEL0708]|nr:Stabilin-2 [Gaertneriomyces sp. JEL0708]
MRATIALAALAALAASANAATCAEIIAQRADTTTAAAALAANPAWSAATPKTLIVPTDEAVRAARGAGILPANHHGVFFLAGQAVLNKERPNYKILKGADTAIMFDEFSPDQPTWTNDLHLRSSMEAGVAVGQLTCDDGRLYISPITFPPAVKPSQGLTGIAAAAQFRAALQSLNVLDAVDNLKDYTIFAPNDAAMAAAKPQLDALTPNQRAAVLAAHFGKTARFSTELSGTEWPTLLPGYVAPLVIGSEEGPTTVGGSSVVMPDTASSAGVIYLINKVIFPPEAALAAGSPSLFGAAGNTSATVSTPATPTATGTSSTGAPILTGTGTRTPAPTQTQDGESGALASGAGILGAAAAGVLGLAMGL